MPPKKQSVAKAVACALLFPALVKWPMVSAAKMSTSDTYSSTPDARPRAEAGGQQVQRRAGHSNGGEQCEGGEMRNRQCLTDTGQQVSDGLGCVRTNFVLLLSAFAFCFAIRQYEWQQYKEACIVRACRQGTWDKAAASVQDGSGRGNAGSGLQDTVKLTHRTCCNEPAGPERRNEQRQGPNQGGKASTNAARRK